MDLLTVIVPCYNEEESLPLFYEEIIKLDKIITDIKFSFLFVDDGSSDNTLNILKDLHITDERVRYLSFSKNFGKESAIYAALENSKGDFLVLIDADLQHPPALIPEMLNSVRNGGYDCAATCRITRDGEPHIRSLFAKCFYKIINKISELDLVDGAQDYRLMTRQVADSILDIKEYNRFSKGIFNWVGFKTKWIEHENVDRIAGETKWSFWGLVKYSLQGIIEFSVAPLLLSSVFGMIFCLISFIMICVIVVKTLIWGDPVAGFPTLICVIFLIGGIQLFSIGIVGAYLSKTYLEIKNRPIYIIKETEE